MTSLHTALLVFALMHVSACSQSAEKPTQARAARSALVESTSTDTPTVTAAPVTEDHRGNVLPFEILVPRDPSLRSSMLVTSGPEWVAFSAQVDGATVSLHGVRKVHDRNPALAKTHTEQVRGVPATAGDHEAIKFVIWSERGIAWSLEVECALFTDPRCMDTAYVLELADGLRPGGTP